MITCRRISSLLVRGGGLAACAALLACSEMAGPAGAQAAPVQTSATSYVLVKDWVGWKTEIPTCG